MATGTKVKLTLRIDNSANKVIFAEAKKDFVDILFNILSLPFASVIKLLENEDTFGSIDNLYKSLENMDKYHLQPNHNKDQLLNPGVTASVLCDPLMFLPEVGPRPKQRTLYKCEKDRHITDSKYAACANCYAEMNYQLWYVEFQNAKNVSGGDGGVVTPLTTYMVMDDLCVKPFSMISIVDLLQNNVKNAKDIDDLEERFVEFGPDEALELLRTSLKSKASLTNVFLKKKKEVYEGEGRLRTAEEDRMEVLERKLKMVMDDQERMRADMEIMVNAVLNNTAAVQPLVAVDQNQVPPSVTIHREIIGPSNRQGPADQPARCTSLSRPGTGSKTIVSRTIAKGHRHDDWKHSPSAKRRAVEEEDEGEEVRPGMKVAEQFKKQSSIIAKEPEELKKGKASDEEDPLSEFNAPLPEEFRKAALPKALRIPQEKYSGLTDPLNHLEQYYWQMKVQHTSEMAMCRMFPTTFDGAAKNWFRKLSAGSITSFHQFEGVPPPKDPSLLQYIRQESGETLKDYLKRYHKVVVHTGVFNEKETLKNFWRNLRTGALLESFEEKHPETYKDAFTRAVMQVQKDEKYRLKRELEEAFSLKRKGALALEFISALQTDPHPDRQKICFDAHF